MGSNSRITRVWDEHGPSNHPGFARPERRGYGRAVKLLVWMQHMADRLGMAPGRSPTRRWMLRFAAAIMVSLALWALFLWALMRIVDWAAPL